jgi:hypothetical protein
VIGGGGNGDREGRERFVEKSWVGGAGHQTTSSVTSDEEVTVPGKRVSMRKTREVLRLYFELKLGQRQIARSANVSQSTVHEYLNAVYGSRLELAVAGGDVGGRTGCGAVSDCIQQSSNSLRCLRRRFAKRV